MDDVSYGALALALTVLAGIWAWFSYQRRGLGAGLKWLGIAVLPIAAYLTRTLRMLAEVGDAVGDWATRLVLSPVVWVGIVLAGVGVALFVAGRALEARGSGADAPARARGRSKPKERGPEQFDPSAPTQSTRSAQLSEPARGRSAAPVDDDLADIEALLKSRGIT